MIEVIFKIFLTDYIDFQGFITKRVQKPFLIEYIDERRDFLPKIKFIQAREIRFRQILTNFLPN
jgi:hypothetical protein